MSRRHRLFIGLAAVVVGVVVLLAASLPWLVTTVIQRGMAAQGFTDVRLQVDSLTWRGLRVQGMRFIAFAGGQRLDCDIPEMQIEYRLTELLAGRVSHIHVPVAVVHAQAVVSQAPDPAAALPLATLLSGRWLAQLPVQDFVLAQLNLTGLTTATDSYALQVNAKLHAGQLQVNGEITPASASQKPLKVSLLAHDTGEARLFFSLPEQAAQPVLGLVVNPIADTRMPLALTGTLEARLNTLMPLLSPWLPALQSLSHVEGELSSWWQAQIQDQDWHVSGAATVQGLSGRWAEQTLPRSELTASYELTPQQLTAHASLTTGEKAVALQVEGKYQLANGQADAEFTLTPVKFKEGGFVLSKLLTDWPYPFDVTAGTVAGKGRIVWRQALTMTAAFQLNTVGGHYNKLAFTGATGKLAVTTANGLHTTQDAQLQVKFLDVGFPVEKLQLGFALRAQANTPLPVVQVKQFEAAALGGKVFTDPFEVNLAREQNAVVVQLEGLGLSEILQLEQQDGIQGSGKLDGQIPLEITPAGITVAQGKLTARDPGGHIKYTPTEKVTALAQANTSVNLVVEALSNFQYHLMDVTSDYHANGDLIMQVRLEGKNPGWQGGQPIHLNLNLHENIPALLRSLQLGDELSGKVSKRYEKKK